MFLCGLVCFSGVGAGRTTERQDGGSEHQLYPEMGLGRRTEPGRDLHHRIHRVGLAHTSEFVKVKHSSFTIS